jgi:hypothetical protein
MTDISIDASKLPIISDKNSWDTSCEICMNRVKQTYTDAGIILRSYWRDYRNWIIFGLTLLVIGMIILLVILLPSSTQAYPCRMYETETMASAISVDCLQYVWDANCRTKQPYLFPQSYTGWWRQSPQGGTMISCHISPSACGVGSYGNILVYMQFCKIKYNQ